MSIYSEEEEKVFAELAAYEKEVNEHNDAIFKSIGATDENIKDLMDCSTITDKITEVEAPKGQNDYIDPFGPFKETWTDQTSHSMGETGDYWYTGFIYAKIGKNKWLKIPYEC